MDYFESVIALLQEIRQTQAEAIEKAARAIADAIAADHLLYIFGASHASILSQEMFYRAGGLVPVVAVLAPGLTTEVRPAPLTSKIERLPGFGPLILAETAIGPGDVVIVHSVSGRNAVPIEFAQGARQRGAFVIALTSLQFSRSVKPRQPGSPRLFEAADLVLDNCAPPGDALVELPGGLRVGPVSTVTGAAILDAIVCRVAELLLEKQGPAANPADVPVFISGNLDQGDSHNQRWLDHYRGRLPFLV